MGLIRGILFTTCCLVFSMGVTSRPADAAPKPPPIGYQQAVVENFVNPTGETVTYRRGWHAGGSTGFGYDKVSRKHAITNVQIVHSVVRHPQVVRQETPTRWVHEKEALLVGLAGPSQSVVVRVVLEYGEWAGPGQMGVVTAYCVGIQGKCPDWVNRAFSID